MANKSSAASSKACPRYLRPGGRFYALTMGSDRDHPFEHRLREWLGPAESDFDVAFVKRITRTPREWAAESVISKKGAVTDIPNWRAFFENLHVQALVYGFVMIQRRAQPRPVFTVRRQIGPRTGPAEHAWLFDWETAPCPITPPGSLDTPRAVPGIRLRVDHNFEDGNWMPNAYLLETDYPFNSELPAQAWTAHLLHPRRRLPHHSRTARTTKSRRRPASPKLPRTPSPKCSLL